MAGDSLKKKTITGLFWAFAERVGAQLVNFVVSIVLARILMPEEYGIIGIVLVFVNLCNVFVDSGFGKALIQKKDADDLDFSSAFYFGLTLSVVLYGILFCAAPWIAALYDMELLSPVIRVMGLRLIVAAYNSVQKANVAREMQFKRFFFSTLGGTLISAVIGIVLAWRGFGVWALVAQELTNVMFDTAILSLTIRWHPRLMFSLQRAKALFRYGWKVLVAGLVDTLYADFRSLYIGKLYSADDLAFYTRGKQFPYLLVDNVNASISSVLFPAMSSCKDDVEEIKGMTRRSMTISAYILSPLMCGLAAVAEPLVLLLLTEKWLPCVPFLQILCINCALTPLQSANLQAIYALGRSDIALRLNVIKKTFGFVMVIVFARISVLAMAWAGVVSGLFSLIVNTAPNRKLMGYGIWEQLRDVVPSWLLSGAMAAIVRLVALLELPLIAELVVMILVGMASYVALSAVFRVESFRYLLGMLRPVLNKFKK